MTPPIRILIIDDEETICRGVRAKILRVRGPQVRSVLWTTDPSRADAIVDHQRIDLVLCDLRMPNDDGIDVLTRLRTLKPTLHTAIITGLDDFEHARAAIRLGVAAYLLKPIDSHELAELLDGVVGRIEANAREEARRLLIETDGWVRSALEEDRPDLLERPDFEFHGGACMLIGGRGDLAPQTKRLIAELLVQAPLHSSRSRFYPFDAGIKGIGCIAALSPDADPAEVASAVGRHLREETDARLIVALSRPCEHATQLAAAWREVVTVFRYRLVDSGSVVLSAYGIESRAARPVTQDERLLIDRVVGFADSAAPPERLLELFERDRLAAAGPGYFSELYDAVRTSLRQQVPLPEPLPPVDHYSSLDQLRTTLQQVLDTARDAVVRGERDRVSVAAEYVEQHFAENIDMQAVCDRVGLSYAYFSRAFKDRHGLNFHDHLTRLRLRAALALLPRPDLSLDEIARRVGYTNRKSFVRAYKRVYGQPPRRDLAIHE